MANHTKQLTVGSNLNALDIYLNVDGAPINASGISFNGYDADGFIAFSGVPENPEIGHYTASGIVPANHSLGNWHIDWRIYPLAGGFVTAAEEFFVQQIGISFTLNAPGEVVSSLYDRIRIDVGDSQGLIFVDSYLARVLQKAVVRLNNKLGLSLTPLTVMNGIPGQFGGVRIQPIHLEINFDSGTITPPGDTYEDLLVLQSEYIIATSEIAALKRLNASVAAGPDSAGVSNAVNDGIMVRNPDGTTIDVSVGRLQTRASLYRFHAESLEKELEDACRRFLNRITGRYGKLIY